MNKDVIVALDFENEDKLNNFINKFKDTNCFVKVGMELYYQYGPQIINKLKDYNFKIFLDLKLHDIPTTVIKSMSVLKDLNIDIVNLHATVGSTTMKEVANLFKDSNTKVIAVTCLTSTDSNMLNNELNVNLNMDDYVISLAKLSYDSGLDGVVCSPLEVKLIKENTSNNFLCITPGIRYNEGSDDQKRVTSPKEAYVNGSDYIVVGRLIINSDNPLDTYNRIKNEFLGEE